MVGCCRSINYQTALASQNESNCEMLHNVVYNTTKELLEKNSSYDYVYLVFPSKVNSRIIILLMELYCIIVVDPEGLTKSLKRT